MLKNMQPKVLPVFLSLTLAFGLSPATALADDAGGTVGDPIQSDPATASAAASYSEFLASLKVLEGYAEAYSETTGEDSVGLVINYIRTGIEKYNTDSWAILAGAENTAFATYVAEQDEANATNAQAVRGIGTFETPDGEEVEFAHMFGAMNIAWYNSYASVNVDFGSWAGDLVDLMEYSKGKVTSTEVEQMANEIRTTYLGIDDPEAHSFGWLDVRGDLDAYYFASKLSAGSTSLSSLMEAYYSETLTDEQRAAYFLNNRFGGNTTQDAVRTALYDAYKGNSGVIMLEADRGLSSDDDLRAACCYAFADYLFGLADGQLIEGGPGEGGDTPSEGEDPGDVPDNPYYSVFSNTSSTLAPGVTQDITYALTADDKQIVYYTATVDITRDDVSIFANYQNNDGSVWGMSRVTDQMAAAQAKHSNPDDADNYIENYNAILGVNADFYNMTTGAPSGALVMEGVEYNGVGSENFFAILKGGTAVIGGSSEWAQYQGQIQEAVGGSVYLVKDGKIAVNSSADYYNSRASRTCVGIKADGQVVLMVLDGRQEPFSAGGSAEEIAQIMLEAGCVTAINLDGGGSSTFAAKAEGSDEVSVTNRPSDGYERSVSSSLVVVSTAKVSNEFDHAIISTEKDYLTVGSSLDVAVSGASATGNAAEVPEGAVLCVSDEAVATISDGVLTGVSNGDVDVELVVGDSVVGSKTVHVVTPDGVTFGKSEANVVYGVGFELPVIATYNGNQVEINPADISFELSANAGTVDGFVFTGSEESGIRVVAVTASLAKDLSVHASMTLNLYKNGEAIFDFDGATEGDKSFAWDRDVSNSTTEDSKTYHISNPDEAVDISYIFALDMKEIEIPDQIKPLIALLPGGDSADATAWSFLLQLAERVSVLTEVKVTLQVDPSLEIDYSGMTLVNEYFTLTSAEYDEGSHTLTATFNWIDQTQAIDPATANSICILSGIKAAPKPDAEWGEDERLSITNIGDVSYDIYLRSSTLYSVACDTGIQEAYGLQPFINPNDTSEKGAHFGTTYSTFEDSFTLDKKVRQGWMKIGEDNLCYFVDNVALTGIQLVPGYEDEENDYFYSFDENGSCLGKVTGLIQVDGDLYYAVNGDMKTGWRLISDQEGDKYYFFDPITGKAVDGQQEIYGYRYTFTDFVLTRGDLVESSEGLHYKWAGEWVMNSWVEIDGNKYYAGKAPYGYFVTSPHIQIHKYGSETEMGYCLFDDKGVWQEQYSGLYTEDNGDTYLVENGYLSGGVGLVCLDGDYYYFRTSTGTAVKDRTYWVTATNGLLPSGQYAFDESGKMVKPPSTDPDPDPDPEPEPEPEPEPDVKDGIVSENNSLYYYVDGVLTGAGLVQIDGDYYYVRTSNGEVVHGKTYWVTATNGLLPAGEYQFADDGKMVNPPATDPDPVDPGNPDPVDPDPDPQPEVKNGIVSENNSLYYYVDGVLTGAGLVQIDGDYYYVRTSNGEVVHGRIYWVTATNGLLPAGEYWFADDGKMVNPPTNEAAVI